MNLQSILVVLGLIAAFVAAIAFIAKNGGWSDDGCTGNCASCHSRCETPKPKQE